MMFGLLGAMAIAPILRVRTASLVMFVGVPGESSGRCKVSAFQVCPPSSDRQTPPLAAVTKIRFGLVGSTVTPEMRPLVAPPPGTPPLSSGAGPIGVQVGTSGSWVVGSTWLSRMLADGQSRASNCSSRSRVGAGRRIGERSRRLNIDFTQPFRAFVLMVCLLRGDRLGNRAAGVHPPVAPWRRYPVFRSGPHR